MKKRKMFTIFSLGLLFMLSGCFGSSSGGSSNSGSSDKTDTSANSNENFIFDGDSVKAKDTSISGDLVIPSEFNGQKITTIPKDAFKGCSQITSIVVPDSVLTINDGAFSGCTRLQSMTLPFVGSTREKYNDGSHFGRIFGTTNYGGSIEVKQNYDTKSILGIQPNTYYVPATLKKVTITDATQIGMGAFMNCKMLDEINLNDDIIAISDYSFCNCSSIKNINLGNIYEIKKYSLAGCTNLEEFYIGPNVTTIYSYAFSNCIGLSRINSSSDGEYVIPSTVQSIGDAAFYSCIKMQSIMLPFSGISRTGSERNGHFGKIFGTQQYTGGTLISQCFDTGNILGIQNETYYVPSGLRTITITDASKLGRGALSGLTMITELNVNSGVKGAVGPDAFKNTITPRYFSTIEIKSDIEGTVKLNGFSDSGGVKNATKELEIIDENKTSFNNSSCKYVYFSIYYDNYGEKVNVFDNWGMVKFIFKDKDGNAIFTSNDIEMKHNDKYRTDEFNHKMTIADFNKLDKVELYFWYDKQDVLGASGNWSGQDYNVKNIKVVMQSI